MSQTSPSVLLIRLDGIGDALALAPLLAALHERAIATDLVLSHANIDAFALGAVRDRWIAPFGPRDGSRANLDAIAAFGKTMRERGYTHALVATEDSAGYRLARWSGARERIGFINGWGKPLKTLWARSLLTGARYRSAGPDARAPHECEVLFGLGATLLGADARPTRDVALLRPLVIEGAAPSDARVAFQVTDKWDRLNVSFEQVVECARAFGRHYLHAFASRREMDYARRFEQASGIRVDIFDDVRAWKSAIAAASALIAPDGGAIHVAGMVGTPVAAVFPPQRNFARQTARWSPWASPFRIVRATGKWAHEAADAASELARIRPGDRA